MSTLGTQFHMSKAYALAQAVSPVKNDPESFPRRKPAGTTGLWTSTWDAATRSCEWVDWCLYNDFDNPATHHWHLLTPSRNARILVIDTLPDLLATLDRYPYINPEYGYLGLKYMRGFDFEAMANDYDALHLTSHGARRLHLSMPVDMNAWDCESTVWFRWCFTSVIRIEAQEAAS